jgi:hypothetical protein
VWERPLGKSDLAALGGSAPKRLADAFVQARSGEGLGL